MEIVSVAGLTTVYVPVLPLLYRRSDQCCPASQTAASLPAASCCRRSDRLFAAG